MFDLEEQDARTSLSLHSAPKVRAVNPIFRWFCPKRVLKAEHILKRISVAIISIKAPNSRETLALHWPPISIYSSQ